MNQLHACVCKQFYVAVFMTMYVCVCGSLERLRARKLYV